MDNFRLQIITPERIFFDGDAYMVEFNTTEGEIGVYANHIPLTCIIKPGILTIRMDGEEKEAALHSGFVEILPDKVTILAEVIEWPEEIDLHRAEAAMERAKERIAHRTSDTDIARAETALMRAMARITLIK
ncbi:MAG: ATP synthase F1 subunit epsilon [Lachnospiraceae bacterium]|nr:ATP synthase F1 subunit epsilon [Lachnospiraceae bacterium]